MKRLFKLFTLLIVLLFVTSLTSCADNKEVELKNVNLPIVLDISTDDKTFVGYYTFDEANKTGKLYLVGASIPQGEYEEVFINKTDKDYSFPSYAHRRSGYQFAGWYQTEEFINGMRVTTLSTSSVDADKVIYAKYITYADAGMVAIVCVVIVFAMLALLWGIVALFKYIKPKQEVKQQTNSAQAPVQNAPKKALKVEDIKDEDMMVAALIATIDYHNETNEDVRVVSIKQIG